MKGFIEKDEKVSPGLALYVLSDNEEILYSSQDILSNNKNVDKELLAKFGAYFSAAYPYLNNEKYKLKIDIWDKNGEGKYQFEMPFSIKGNENINVESQKCSYRTYGLFDPTSRNAISENVIVSEKAFQLYFEGITNFKDVEGRVYPSMHFEFIDEVGDSLIVDNILSSVADSGIDAEVFNRYFSTNLYLSGGSEIETSGKITITLKDTRSEAKITAVIDVILKSE